MLLPSTGWVSTDGGADAQGGANGSISNGGLSVDWSSNGTWNTNNGAENGDNKLMNGYIDAVGGKQAAQVAISGINAEFADGYDLYVYFSSDGNNRTGKVQLVDGATYSYNTFSQQGGATSQNSTPEQPTKVTETQNLTMLSMRDYPETLRRWTSSAVAITQDSHTESRSCLQPQVTTTVTDSQTWQNTKVLLPPIA